MKTALITGALGGMGKACAMRLTSGGYRVVGLDVKEPEGDVGFEYVRCDLTDGADVESAFRRLKESGVSLDCIVNTAGMYDLNSLVEMGEEEFLRVFDVNVFSAYRVNKTFLPLLNDGARIIVVTSELAPLDPLPFTGIYAVTKAALDKYAASLRMELGLLGYTVVTVRPGAVDTDLLGVSTRRLDDFTENTKLYSYNAEKFKAVVDGVEAKKIPPEKIAGLVAKALAARRPKCVYNVNRNPLLLLLNALPESAQFRIIKRILKKRG